MLIITKIWVNPRSNWLIWQLFTIMLKFCCFTLENITFLAYFKGFGKFPGKFFISREFPKPQKSKFPGKSRPGIPGNPTLPYAYYEITNLIRFLTDFQSFRILYLINLFLYLFVCIYFHVYFSFQFFLQVFSFRRSFLLNHCRCYSSIYIRFRRFSLAQRKAIHMTYSLMWVFGAMCVL